MLNVVSKFIGPFMPGVGRKLEDALGDGREDGEVNLKDGNIQAFRVLCKVC